MYRSLQFNVSVLMLFNTTIAPRRKHIFKGLSAVLLCTESSFSLALSVSFVVCRSLQSHPSLRFNLNVALRVAVAGDNLYSRHSPSAHFFGLKSNKTTKDSRSTKCLQRLVCVPVVWFEVGMCVVWCWYVCSVCEVGMCVVWCVCFVCAGARRIGATLRRV